jgi:photosystem II stability/assembly factor-like uncharacterized protein
MDASTEAAARTARTDRAWVATKKGLFELRHEGRAGWRIERLSFRAEPVSMLLPPRADGRMLAALNLGHFGVKVHASADAGASWSEVACPTFPPQPEGAAGPPWKLVQIWSLEAAHGTVWCGTLPGGLFRSADFGASWQLVEALWSMPERAAWGGGGYDVPGLHSICPHPRRAGHAVVAVSSGGVWATEDDGATWALRTKGLYAEYMPPELAEDGNSQDPHCVVRCAAEPEVLWCQHHNGVWRSTDEARTWVRVQPPLSAFGFAVAVHPRHGRTAWLVPGEKDERRLPVDAAFAVNRTDDGGESFVTQRSGLPQQHAYHLVYRHALDVAADGERLLMGSTTGGLFASDDGGAQWHVVSRDLPPIAAVRFG